MNPKISVIMPVYNTKDYLVEALESILNQSFKDFEFIIVDDYSTDWSYELLQEYEKKDDRIRLYRNEKNMWISFTRNKLIDLCTTNYIASQDSDDVSLLDRLELEYNFLENNKNYAVVSWDNMIINEQSKVVWYRKYSDDIWNIILKKSPISQWSSLFRKNIFIELWWYDKTLNYAEDYDLWLRIFLKWYKIKNLSNDLYKVRIRLWQSKSAQLKQTIKNTLFVQKKAIKSWLKATFSDKVYIFLEQILMLLPSNFILWLFKKLEYKNEQ